MKIATIVGTRPNFIKLSALVEEIKNHKIRHILIHTGQHYDDRMSRLFFEELGMPKPDVNLEVGSGTCSKQISSIISRLEKVLIREKPNLVIVVGDVNSTFAGALTAKQLGIRVAHVESGLRSFDMKMPEEINRILTDRISDFLFTTEESANRNLLNEGVQKEKIFFVGNVMIDALLRHKKKSESAKILEKLNISKKTYAVLTLHRPSNVDTKKDFENIVSILESVQKQIKIIFPVHPRTSKNIKKFNLSNKIKNMQNLVITEPLGYLDFLCLMANSRFVLTDSGGIQEEATVLGVPCITLRNNTERPVTLKEGTNVLVSTNKAKILNACNKILRGKLKGRIPHLWDGKAAKRIMGILVKK